MATNLKVCRNRGRHEVGFVELFRLMRRRRERRRPGGRDRLVRVDPVEPRFLVPPAGCTSCWGRNRGWSLRSTPGYPLGPRRGRLWRGGRGGRRLAAQGASRSPSPAQRAGLDRPRPVPAQRANPFLSMPARFVERLARWAGRGGGGSHQGLRPWLGERLALWAERRTIWTSKGTGTYSLNPGILTVLRLCVPSKRSPTQITRRDTKPIVKARMVWVPHGHGRTRRSAGRSVRGSTLVLLIHAFWHRLRGAGVLGGRGPGVVAALDPRLPSGTPLGSVVARAWHPFAGGVSVNHRGSIANSFRVESWVGDGDLG